MEDREFSVKSLADGAPSLVNASGATMFLFRTSANPTFSEPLGANPRIEMAEKLQGRSLTYIGTANGVFLKNLHRINAHLDQSLATLVKLYYLGHDPRVSELTKRLVEENPAAIRSELKDQFYTEAIKEFLLAMALGMQPAMPWDGFEDASGGYIILLRNGSIGALTLHSRDKFKDYLFANTCLGVPSLKRYRFGYINSERVLSLALQIRFSRPIGDSAACPAQ